MAVTIDGVEIPEDKIQAEMEAMRQSYVEFIRANDGKDSDEELRQWAVENLVEEHLFRRAAARLPVPAAKHIKKELATHHELYADYPREERKQRAAEMLQIRLLKKQILQGIKEPEEEEIRAWFEENLAGTNREEGRLFFHICLIARPGEGKFASDNYLILLKLRTTLLDNVHSWRYATHSVSETFDEDGGLFTLVKGETLLPAAVEEQLLALKVGEASDVIDIKGTSQHLFYLLEIIPEEPETLDFNRDGIRLALMNVKKNQALEAWVDRQKESAAIKVQ